MANVNRKRTTDHKVQYAPVSAMNATADADEPEQILIRIPSRVKLQAIRSASANSNSSYRSPRAHSPDQDEKQQQQPQVSTPLSSVYDILDDLQANGAAADNVPPSPLDNDDDDDAAYATMNELLNQRSLSMAQQVKLRQQRSTDSALGEIAASADVDDPPQQPHQTSNKLRHKYNQLKEKYAHLSAHYQQTQSMRDSHDRLASENSTLQQQLDALQGHISQQKNTIIRQNKTLLQLQSERDDFADVVVEQERRASLHPSGPTPLLAVSTASNSLSPGPRLQQGGHNRSNTSPNGPRQEVGLPGHLQHLQHHQQHHHHHVVDSSTHDQFVVDPKFMMSPDEEDEEDEEKKLEADDDDEKEEEEEEVMPVLVEPTPGDTPLGGRVNLQLTAGAKSTSPSFAIEYNKQRRSTKQAKFIEVDDIDRSQRRYYGMSRCVLTSEIDPRRAALQWQKIIGEVVDDDDVDGAGASMAEQSSTRCDAWYINECEAVQRMTFVLVYYHQWLAHKATLQKRKHRASRNVFAQSAKSAENMKNAGYPESMTEFIGHGLRHYSQVQLLNDFYHIKKFHVSDPNTHDSVFKHFVQDFGFCDVKHCTSFRRNHREKSFFGHHNRFRRWVYHLDATRFADLNEYDAKDDNEYELAEINLQQTLDMIHSTLIHDYHNTTTDNLTEFARQLLKNTAAHDEEDATTNVQTPRSSTNLSPTQQQLQQQRRQSTTRAAHHLNGQQSVHSTSQFSYKTYNAENTAQPSAPLPLPLIRDQSLSRYGTARDSMATPRSPQQEDPESLTLDVFAYGFGVRFSYWMPTWPDFVQPKHADLRAELLENDIYRISAFEWGLLRHRAAMFMRTNEARTSYVAKFKGSGHELMNIQPGAPLSVEHLIALYTYTNYPNIRISFQKACLKATSDETFVSVRKRHEQIAHWARLLYEAVYLYGDRMSDGQRFFHILRSKIMLSKFSANLSCPTTMIANRKIVSHSNIVMEVENAHSRGATFLDISCFSDVPNREERLFFFGDLAIDNVILKAKSHRHYMKSLTLFQKIAQGSYFSHTPLKKIAYQRTIVDLIENMMRSKDYGGVSNYAQMLKLNKARVTDEDVIEENGVPLYIQHLFDYFCAKLKTIWINAEEFVRLQPDLQRMFAKSSKHGRMTTANNMNEVMASGAAAGKKESIMGPFTKFLHFEHNTNFKYCCTLHWEISGNALKQFWRGQKIFGQEFRVSTIRLFPYCVKDSSKGDGQFRFGIPIKSMPKYLQKIEFRVDLYIPQINYMFSAFSIIDERGTYWYSLFDSSLLRNFSQFTLKISFRLINLIVSSNQNGGGAIDSNLMRSGSSSANGHRGGLSTMFKLENLRRESGTQMDKVRERISSKFQMKS